MPDHRVPVAMNLSALALLLVAGGCSTSAPAPDVYRRAWRPDDIQPQGMRLVLTEGDLDIENLYPSTLLAKIAIGGGGSRSCSAVLIDPRLALTAAHCVCGIPKPRARIDKPRTYPPATDRTVMDRLTCAASATVAAFVYNQQTREEPKRLERAGKVRPHPEFRIVLDPQGNVLENEADLAVVVLDEAFNTGEVPPVPLARGAVSLKDLVTLVGFGYDSINGRRGERQYGKNTVAAQEARGKSFLVGQEGSHTLGGDSGGPCLRDGMLVGIATTSSSSPPVAFSEFTSTYFYRDWLNSEIAGVRKVRPATVSDAP